MKYCVHQFQGFIFFIVLGKLETSSAIKQYTTKLGVRGIAITYIHSDNEFEKVRGIIRPIHDEISARGKHVGDIKREVRTLKEPCLCKTPSIPYTIMPRIQIEANLKDKFHWHNIFTPKY